MTMPTTVRHSQAVTSRGTEHSLHESATCHKTDQTSSSHQCRYVVRWQSPQCVAWCLSRGSEGTSLGSARAKWWFRWQQSGELEAYLLHSTIGVRGHHERRTLPHGTDQEASGIAVLCRERAARRSHNIIRRTWDPERDKGLGDIVPTEFASGCLSNDVLGQPQKTGQSEAR